jgi:hypothetical protein
VLATASGPASSVFDKGLPVGRTAWIDDGRLAALLRPRASARLTDLPVTPANDNLAMELPGSNGRRRRPRRVDQRARSPAHLPVVHP